MADNNKKLDEAVEHIRQFLLMEVANLSNAECEYVLGQVIQQTGVLHGKVQPTLPAQDKGDELLPCPWRCSAPPLHNAFRAFSHVTRKFRVECVSGKHRTKDRNTQEEADVLWNSRGSTVDSGEAAAGHYEWDDNEPLVGDGMIAGRCDYRYGGCSETGTVVDGVWRCQNHLSSTTVDSDSRASVSGVQPSGVYTGEKFFLASPFGSTRKTLIKTYDPRVYPNNEAVHFATIDPASELPVEVAEANAEFAVKALNSYQPDSRASVSSAQSGEKVCIALKVAKGLLTTLVRHDSGLRPKGAPSEVPRECPCCEKTETEGVISHYLSCHFEEAQRVVDTIDDALATVDTRAVSTQPDEWIICADCGQQRAASTLADGVNTFVCRSCLSTKAVSTSPEKNESMESALAELREMFPNNELTIDFATRPDGWQQVSIFRFAPPNLSDTILVEQCRTLTEAMEKVRQHHASLPAPPVNDEDRKDESNDKNTS